ncbi:hypothetical protein GA0074692_0990 [Micromonospora pallida]|uniref:HprK-related kinase B n=1 Tax=Micromonospora pallida TaxID=145854 RepID=A0A1C6RUB4_9ACTN|nr:hypothetical protein [Micromonospora pallida]SCL20808.1 hypothetical protein GA0074692_0990 [Micromonospora pallida]
MNVDRAAAAEPAGGTAQLLLVRGHQVRIRTESPGSAALVAETFHPPGMQSVEVVPGEDGRDDEPELTIIDLVRDQADIQALLDEVAGTATRGEFELTRGFRQPRYDIGDHTVFTLRDVNSDEVAALVRTGRRAVLVRPRSRLGDRWLTRLIRDVATRFATAAGSLILHSSALVYAGCGWLVVGDSGAGKSTTAIALARLLPSAGWMGNDRMHVDRADGFYRLTACPLPLAINKGSLDVMGIAGFEDWNLRAGMPGPESDWDRFHGEDKMKLSCREVTRYLGVPVISHAPLGGVILPRVDPTAAYYCERSTLEYAAEVIGRNCFSRDDNLYGEDWLRVPVSRRTDPPSLEVFLENIAELPLLRCSVGSAADLASLAGELTRSAWVAQ